jgi:glycine cleavage system transcriptional repressor
MIDTTPSNAQQATPLMTTVLVVGTGPDQPGLVAGLTQLLSQLGGNIQDASMTKLANTFAMLLLVSLPQTAQASLTQQSQQVALQLGITLDVRPVALTATPVLASPATPLLLQQAAMITVAGHDHMGITASVTRLLADHGVNITDLNAQRFMGDGGLVYMMLIEVLLPTALSLDALKALLMPLSQPLGVDIRIEALESVAL